MNQLVISYAKVTVDSLDGLPSDLQHIVSSIRSCDMRVTNVLSEIERPGLNEDEFTRLALQLKNAYKSKKETAVRFVTVLRDQLEQLDARQKYVLEQVDGLSAATREDMDEMQGEKDINSPNYGTSKSLLDPIILMTDLKMKQEQERSKLKRKPTPTDVDSRSGVQQVRHTPATMSVPSGTSAGDKRVCSCEAVPYGDMVLCDNDQCRVGWYHFACVGLGSKPLHEWYCRECVNL